MKSKTMSNMRPAWGMGAVCSPREVTWKDDVPSVVQERGQSIWTLAGDLGQRWSVSQVSLHAESGMSGQGDDGFM